MKIYFTCSARGEDDFGDSYLAIFNTLTKLGHKLKDDYRDNNDADLIYNSPHDSKVDMYRKHVTNIKSSDVVVVEVSLHSLSMGYIMNKALDLGKPVIALHAPGREPAFAVGIEDDKLQVIEYKEEDLESILAEAIDYAKNQSDTRFNFFISPGQINFLDKISKDRRIPRSVYLRRLIEADMAKNEDYLEQA